MSKMGRPRKEIKQKQFEELWEEQQSQDLPFVQMIYGNNGLFVTAAMWVSVQRLYTKGLSNSSEDNPFFVCL